MGIFDDPQRVLEKTAAKLKLQYSLAHHPLDSSTRFRVDYLRVLILMEQEAFPLHLRQNRKCFDFLADLAGEKKDEMMDTVRSTFGIEPSGKKVDIWKAALQALEDGDGLPAADGTTTSSHDLNKNGVRQHAAPAGRVASPSPASRRSASISSVSPAQAARTGQPPGSFATTATNAPVPGLYNPHRANGSAGAHHWPPSQGFYPGTDKTATHGPNPGPKPWHQPPPITRPGQAPIFNGLGSSMHGFGNPTGGQDPKPKPSSAGGFQPGNSGHLLRSSHKDPLQGKGTWTRQPAVSDPYEFASSQGSSTPTEKDEVRPFTTNQFRSFFKLDSQESSASGNQEGRGRFARGGKILTDEVAAEMGRLFVLTLANHPEHFPEMGQTSPAWADLQSQARDTVQQIEVLNDQEQEIHIEVKRLQTELARLTFEALDYHH